MQELKLKKYSFQKFDFSLFSLQKVKKWNLGPYEQSKNISNAILKILKCVKFIPQSTSCHKFGFRSEKFFSMRSYTYENFQNKILIKILIFSYGPGLRS